MRKAWPVLAAIILLVPSLAAPAHAGPNREHEQLMADIRMLQEQSQQLQQLLAALADAIKGVTARLDEQAGVTRKAFADQKLQIDTLGGDVRVLREKLDETNVRLTSLSQDVEGLRDEIPQPSPAAATTPGASPADPSAAGATPQAGSPPSTAAAGVPQAPSGTAATGMTPRRLYETAYADYTAGQWSLAIQGFETYLKTYPKSELADDAQYYIGESYAGDSKYRDAAAAYERVIRDYPASNILPEAWYKVGISYDRLGQTDKAREAFEFVVKNYPDSDAGRIAKQGLDRLNRRTR
jgi:tol-pal system protein YbgF